MREFARRRKSGWGARDDSPDATLGAIRSMVDARVYGCVHTYRLHDFVDRLPAIVKLRTEFVLANLVRHPVDLVLSGAGEFRHLYDFDIVVLYRNVARVFRRLESFYSEFAERHELNLADLDTLAFCNAARAPYNLRKDLDADTRIPQTTHWLRMEDLTANHGAFSRAFSGLTIGALECDAAYLTDVFGTGAVNQHRADGRLASTQEKFETLPEWKQELLEMTISESGIRPAYERMGYNFDFLQRTR